MNNRKEFIEKLEKFKFENPEVLLGGLTEVTDLNSEISNRPKGSSKRETSTEACANGDTWYDKDLWDPNCVDSSCHSSKTDMSCEIMDGGGSSQSGFDQTCV